MMKSPTNCGKKPVGSLSIRILMKKAWCDSSLIVLMNSFRYTMTQFKYNYAVQIKFVSKPNFYSQFFAKQMSVQRIVEDSPAIELQAEAQHTSGEVETPVSEAKFN